MAAIMPAGQGAVNWPVGEPSATALVFDEELPLPDSSVDRVLMVHSLEFAENPDILARVSRGQNRPGLVVGFAAETETVVEHASAKRLRKGCDWIVANDVSPATGIMGGRENAVTLISDAGAEVWPRMAKDAVARRLAERIAAALQAR
mgnify:CR=1 FL=1